MLKKQKSARFLTTPTRPIQIDRDRSVAGLVEKMEGISFQGRNLARVHQVWLNMLSDNATIFMGLAGALVAGGMRRLISYLIRNHYIDVLVATGANLFHDLHETLGRYHYIGSPRMNDAELQEAMVDRIFDTLASEIEFREANEWVGNFANTLDQSRPYSTREFLHLLGRELAEISSEDGILTSAYKAKVPIYCPAIGDSAIGIGLATGRIERKNTFQFDIIQDVVETAQIVARSVNTGVIFLGGGTPKNFIQQTELTATVLKTNARGHKYAVQITTDVPYWGGFSGSTFEDDQSWGKVSKDARTATLYCDATIALPILVTALSQTATKALKQRHRPSFTLGRELNITIT